MIENGRKRYIKYVGIAMAVGLSMSVVLRAVFYSHMGVHDDSWIEIMVRGVRQHMWAEFVVVILQLLAMILFIGMGAAFYILRTLRPGLYGAIEIAFGVFLFGCVMSIQFDASVLVNMLSYATALYVIVRGFDNIGRSVREPEDKAAWDRLFR